MATIHFRSPGGKVSAVDGAEGQSVMEAATAAGIAEIEADCGGACACATCHVIVDDEWAARLPAPAILERDMLDFVAEPAATSRLSCQIRVTHELDGLLLHLPGRQS